MEIASSLRPTQIIIIMFYYTRHNFTYSDSHKR